MLRCPFPAGISLCPGFYDAVCKVIDLHSFLSLRTRDASGLVWFGFLSYFYLKTEILERLLCSTEGRAVGRACGTQLQPDARLGATRLCAPLGATASDRPTIPLELLGAATSITLHTRKLVGTMGKKQNKKKVENVLEEEEEEYVVEKIHELLGARWNVF